MQIDKNGFSTAPISNSASEFIWVTGEGGKVGGEERKWGKRRVKGKGEGEGERGCRPENHGRRERIQ